MTSIGCAQAEPIAGAATVSSAIDAVMVRTLRMSITVVAKGDVMSSTELASAEQAIVDEAPKQLLIGGEWRDARGGGTLAVDDPSTGDALCEIADGNAEDGLDALGAPDAMQ